MPTRNVVLTDHQATMITKLVSSGRYQNASEVLREGLRLIEKQEAEGMLRLKTLREAAQTGIADYEAGEYLTFESTDDLEKYLSGIAAEVLELTPPKDK